MVNYKKAIDNFSEAIKINSVYIDAYRNRASTYSLSQQYLLSIKDYYKLITLDKKNKNIYLSQIFFNKNYICDWVDYHHNLKKIEVI